MHGSAWVLNMRATALEKGRAADRRHVILGRSDVHRAVSYRADPNYHVGITMPQTTRDWEWSKIPPIYGDLGDSV